MQLLRALVIGLLVISPTLADADDTASPVASPNTKDARLVPLRKDGVVVGLKVYAIRAGGRFDQPSDKFNAGDTIVSVDGVPVTTDAGTTALYRKVIGGAADAAVIVIRNDRRITLTSKATR